MDLITVRRDQSTHPHNKVLKGSSDRTLIQVIVLVAVRPTDPGKHVSRGETAVVDGSEIKILRNGRPTEIKHSSMEARYGCILVRAAWLRARKCAQYWAYLDIR